MEFWDRWEKKYPTLSVDSVKQIIEIDGPFKTRSQAEDILVQLFILEKNEIDYDVVFIRDSQQYYICNKIK